MGNPRTATLTFLGAAGTVTGSKYLLTVDDRRVLVDAGMFQGEKRWRLKNREPFPVKLDTIKRGAGITTERAAKVRELIEKALAELVNVG